MSDIHTVSVVPRLMLLVLLGIFPKALAQDLPLPYMAHYYFVGQGDQAHHQLDLALTGPQVASGRYVSEQYRAPIRLSGTLDFDGHLKLALEEGASEEKDGPGGDIDVGTLTGEIEYGAFGEVQSLRAQWQDRTGKNPLVEFELAAEYAFLDSYQGTNMVSTRYPIFRLSQFQALNQVLSERAHAEHLRNFENFQRYALEDSASGYFINDFTEIEYLGKNLVSLLSTYYSFTGGAHGNFGFYSETYLATDGKLRLLDLEDLFPKGSTYLGFLARYVANDLKQQGAQWLLDADITELEPKELDVFTLTPAGLTFYFDPYEMGPYAQGSFKVTVPYQSLKDALGDIGLLEKLSD